jgi:hypothetical protein
VSRGARITAAGVLTGWGAGVAALPADARAAAGARTVIALERPALDGERFRRATRECLLGVVAVEALLRDAGLDRQVLRGAGTALLFVTAAGYGASNLEFVTGAAGSLRFPYTAPSVLPAEVAIEFGLTGPYVILVGAAPATVDALWQAGRLVGDGRAERALVLAVETFAECQALWRRARWTVGTPLVETAACVLVEPGDDGVQYWPSAAPADVERAVEARAGCTLACAPLVAAALAREAGATRARVGGTWRGRTATIELGLEGGACNRRKSSTS